MRKAFVSLLLASVAVLFLLSSCQSVQVSQEPEAVPVEEPAVVVVDPVEEAAPEEKTEEVPAPEPEVVPVVEEKTEEPQKSVEPCPFSVGDTGPNGGLVFECNGLFLEVGEPIYQVSNFDESIALCSTYAQETGVSYRLPTIEELLAIYSQLVESWIWEDVEWTYYWSSEEVDELSVKIMNFDTGFEGVFYKEMDFIGIIPVVQIWPY